MATINFTARTFFNVDTGLWAGRSIGVPFPVTDNESDSVFDLDDTLVFGGNVGAYLGTMTFLGTDYPVLANDTTLTILGISATAAQLPNIGSFTITEQVYPACFLTGTGIATPAGEVAIETLTIGDQVLTAEGRAVPVKWIGRRTVSAIFGPAERLLPVRIAAGALGHGVPHTDLTVTTDHAMLVDGVLCNAGALVNGTTITQPPLGQLGATYTVYHIETEAHEVILANGARAETFIDMVSRQAFDNYEEFYALYGNVPEMEELNYPRAMSERQLPQKIKSRLNIRIA